MQRIWGVVTDNLRPVPFAQVRITDSATGNLSTLYDPNGGLTPSTTIANPIITDGAGRWIAAVLDGYYTITAQGSGFPTQIIPFWYAGTMGATPVWGGIAGTLSNQTDLQNALNAKASLSGATFTGGVTATTFTGSGAGLTSGTIPKASLVNMSAAGVIGATAAGACTELLSGGGTTNFLRADGTWAAPASGGSTRNAVADTNYTVTGTGDQYIEFTSISATRTVTLPAANGKAGQTITIKDASGSVSPTVKITITRAGADTLVPGSAITTFDMVTPGSECVLTSDGTSKWTLRRLSRQVQTFTSGAVTWTAPPGVYTAFVDMCAGGGGGCAGNTGTSGAAAGGGGGQIVTGFPTVVPGTGYTVTIGAGGNGGASAGATGTDGSDTTFGALLTAKGGSKGPGTNSSGGSCFAGAYGGSGGKYFIYQATDATAAIGNGGIPAFGNAGYQVGGGVAGGIGGNARGVGGAGGAANTNGGGSGGGASIGNGGAGGAGSAGATGTAGSAATANSGGGGGGGGGSASGFAAGGAGGSGVCVVEWWV